MMTTQDTTHSHHHDPVHSQSRKQRSSSSGLDLRLIASMAARNLVANGWKTIIVGSIICFGTALVIVGASVLRSSIDAMQSTISGSITGDLQIYSSESKEDIDVLGGLNASFNLAPLPDYAAIRKLLEDVPNIDTVVPMGMGTALVTTDSSLDRALGDLRSLLSEDPAADGATQKKARVRELVSALSRDVQSARNVERTEQRDEAATLQPVSTDEFWSSFDADPFAHLEQLENRVANVSVEGEYKTLQYVGTDPAAFRRAFDRIAIVDGAPIEAGQRGLMLSKVVYEEQFKLKTARRLDKLKRAIDVYGARIASDVTLQSLVRENQRDARTLALQLDAAHTANVRGKLQTFLRSTEADVAKLLAQFLDIDDANFQARHAYFYSALAPELELYYLKVGEDILLQGLYRNGYVRKVKLKLTGTFRFKGLEDSPQAGTLNMMDLVSFRELHGLGASQHDAELKALQAAVAAKEVSRAGAERDLFAVKQTDHGSARQTELSIPDMSGTRARHELAAHAGYDRRELAGGAVTSIGIKLRDPSRLEETGRAIEAAGRRAGLPLKAAAWYEASGVLGQFASVLRTVVLIGALIILVVALVVINNALVMATLGRIQELGTLRALGAQRHLVLLLLVVESVLLGAAAGGTGAGLGALVLTTLGMRGIPSGNDNMAFVFGGPRLYPTFGAAELGLALGAVLAVSLISALYPAWLAGRVSPREAMLGEE